MNKYVLQIIISILLLATLNSCKDNNSPSNQSNQNDQNGNLKSNGVLKITTSDGTVKTLTNYKPKIINETGYFTSEINTDTEHGKFKIHIYGYFTNNKLIDILFINRSGVFLGVEYAFYGGTEYDSYNLYINFKDGISADYSNVKKTTIRFSSWMNNKPVIGIIINYDENGNVLSKGEFDFDPLFIP